MISQRRNIATTQKHNKQHGKGHTRRGNDGGLGTIFNRIIQNYKKETGHSSNMLMFAPAFLFFGCSLLNWLHSYSRQLFPHT